VLIVFSSAFDVVRRESLSLDRNDTLSAKGKNGKEEGARAARMSLPLPGRGWADGSRNTLYQTLRGSDSCFWIQPAGSQKLG
jgi:hypothetical protein